MQEKKYGLYIHIPYCASKCGYCDFTSYVGKEDTIENYLSAVVAESRNYSGAAVDTVYIGGGTPSFLREASIKRLLEGVSKYITVDKGAEVSIEANPNSLSLKKAKEYRAAGVNRLSIGLQTVQDPILKTIGRTHVFADFLCALESASIAGFTNISADLMYSLPGEQVYEARESAEKVSKLPLTHISAYALKLEEGVPMFGTVLPSDDEDRAMFYAIRDILEDAGYARYEISNFAKPGYECLHNLKYWHAEEYISLGAAAHSFFKGMRYANTKDLDEYIKKITLLGNAVCQRENAEPVIEAIMLKTRLREGILLSELPNSPKFSAALSRLVGYGLCTVRDRLVLTDRGMDLHNAVVTELLSSLEGSE